MTKPIVIDHVNLLQLAMQLKLQPQKGEALFVAHVLATFDEAGRQIQWVQFGRARIR